MSRESDLALAALLRATADELVMLASMRAGVPPAIGATIAPEIVERVAVAAAPTVKRQVSKYQKAFGKSLKILKKKHPRTPISKLMKKAHRLTKAGMK
ncbi:MAG: hypothetical protein [Circular genetic element sp.]|nr:MAG: hypothetical protein [Circular genetic element sp.]